MKLRDEIKVFYPKFLNLLFLNIFSFFRFKYFYLKFLNSNITKLKELGKYYDYLFDNY